MAISILSLIFGLAGRTFRHNGDRHTAVRSGAASAELQHLDRDSHDWTAAVPTVRFIPPQWDVIAIKVVSPGEPGIAAGVVSTAYIRPPPSC